KDAYGTQQPIALLRMVIGRNGMYQTGGDLSWRQLKDMTYVTAIGPPGGGRETTDPRFVSLFTVYHALAPSSSSLTSIFGKVLKGHLQNGFSTELINHCEIFTRMSLDVY
ncbi:unnamed protein product, partial [Trichobilharzia szidati]